MFYSHEILTNTQHGVATIWLVATVGNGSQRRITRKAIQEVNVPKACETIIDPGAPLALRLQGNLLYGVSRVFAQQCTFVLSDAERTQSDMLSYFRGLQQSELDPQAGKTKRHMITLQDDPNFDLSAVLPRFNIASLDLDALFQTSQHSSNKVSQVTPLTSQISLSSGKHSGLNINLPESSYSGGSYQLPFDLARPSLSMIKSLDNIGETGQLQPFLEAEDPFDGIDFEIDENGNLIGILDEQPELPPLPGPNEEHLIESVDVELPHPLPQPEGHAALMFGEEALPDAEAFAPQKAVKRNSEDSTAIPESSALKPKAPSRRKRRVKIQLKQDPRIYIPGKEFRSWVKNYGDRMEALRNIAMTKDTTPAQAKKNAWTFMYGNGLAGVGKMHPQLSSPHPLEDHFSGDVLEARLLKGETEAKENTSSEKKRGRRRVHSEAFPDEDSDQGQPKRAKEEAEDHSEVGRHNQEDAEGHLAIYDDTAPEIGMEEAPPMEDRHSSSIMPWSRPPSVVPGSSVRGHGSAQKPGPIQSPLLGSARGPSAVRSIDRHSDREGAFGSDNLGQGHLGSGGVSVSHGS